MLKKLVGWRLLRSQVMFVLVMASHLELSSGSNILLSTYFAQVLEHKLVTKGNGTKDKRMRLTQGGAPQEARSFRLRAVHHLGNT